MWEPPLGPMPLWSPTQVHKNPVQLDCEAPDIAAGATKWTCPPGGRTEEEYGQRDGSLRDPNAGWIWVASLSVTPTDPRGSVSEPGVMEPFMAIQKG